MTAVLALALSRPGASLRAGGDGRAALEAAGIQRVCADADLAQREALATPGTTPRPGVASPTRAPWIDANGWRIMRRSGAKYVYDVPAGKAALAAAEAFAYGADAALKIDRADAPPLAAMLKFLESLPPIDLSSVADFALVDDGTARTGEVMNLLVRRNLLFEVVSAPSPRYAMNVRIGSPEFSAEEAADPSAFALKIRRRLTDDGRALRVFGSEVVICRLTAGDGRARLHAINYGGREIEGLRVRVRGAYAGGEAYVAGVGRVPLQDRSVASGTTEFSLPRLTTYGVVDLRP